MKFRMLSIVVFLTSFILGTIFVFSTKEESVIKKDSIKIESKEIREINPEIAKQIENEIIAYETAKDFGGSEMLEEKYWEKETRLKYDFLTTGEFHGDEVKAESGEKWFGLFADNKEFNLASTKISVTPVYDIVVDGEHKNKQTGKKVSVGKNDQPLFLIKNAKFLKEGKVLTLFRGSSPDEEDTTDKVSTDLNTDASFKYEIGGRTYELKVEKIFNKSGKQIFALILESENRKQILNVSNDDYLGVLYWIGDLDNDSKPDFYLSPYFHDNVTENSLFISSEADGKNLVKKAASMTSVGC